MRDEIEKLEAAGYKVCGVSTMPDGEDQIVLVKMRKKSVHAKKRWEDTPVCEGGGLIITGEEIERMAKQGQRLVAVRKHRETGGVVKEWEAVGRCKGQPPSFYPSHCTDVSGHDGPCTWSEILERKWGSTGYRNRGD